MAEMTTRVAVTRVPGGRDDDTLVIEEPLEIRVGEKPVSVTMRTPGDDELVVSGSRQVAVTRSSNSHRGRNREAR